MDPLRSAAKALFAGADLFLPSPPGPRVLIYHQVGAGLGRQMEVTEHNFVLQLNWLSQNRSVVSLDNALSRWDEPRAEDLVVLTFDDGYLDVYTLAYPRLVELGFPFTLYLSTDSIEAREPLGPPGAADPLEWAQIDEMSKSGLLTIGAHTHTHADVRHLSPEQIASELDTSNQLIESRLGMRPEHFAYPWGYWSEPADIQVRERYRSAALGGSPRPKALPDPMLIHRYPVQLSDGFAFFKARVRGGFRLEEGVRRRLAHYDGP